MGFVSDLWEDVTGQTQASAIERGAAMQQRGLTEAQAATEAATERGLGFLSPFQDVATSAIPQAGFLTDPQAQFDFLQSNPLFQAALDEAQTRTGGVAAARGRLSAGDTLQQLSKNVLLSGVPLIESQKGSIRDLLGFGANIAGSQANIATGQGANLANIATQRGDVGAAGEVGAAQAGAQGTQNLLTIGGLFAPAAAVAAAPAITSGLSALALSDSRLKENIKITGQENGFNTYSWDWNEVARNKLGLVGSSKGVLADEVAQIMPEAITYKDGFMMVDYGKIGVKNG